jgi:hypothetical protein
MVGGFWAAVVAGSVGMAEPVEVPHCARVVRTPSAINF